MFISHAGGCCGIREYYDSLPSLLSSMKITRSFIVKTVISTEEETKAIRDWVRASVPNQTRKAVKLGRSVWLTNHNRPSPIRYNKHKGFLTPKATFKAYNRDPDLSTYHAILEAGRVSNGFWLEGLNHDAEIALVASQTRIFAKYLLKKGFVCPLSSINPNTSRRIDLFLYGSEIEYLE
jgi:hypothetical protein